MQFPDHYDPITELNLKGLSNLEHLALCNVSLSDQRLFETFLNLRTLWLIKCTNLKLNSSLTNLETLGLELSNPNDLENLDLTNFNNLKRLIFRAIIYSNTLHARLFHSLSSSAHSLIELDLAWNAIDNEKANSLFENCSCYNLAKLNLGFNRLTELKPKWFCHISRLKELNLQHNGLKCIDLSGFECLENLEKLVLEVNKIEMLSEANFSRLKRLKSLSIGWNPIKVFERDVFKGLEKLENLSMKNVDNGKFCQITEDFFNGLSNLKKLTLEYNSIRRLDPNTFRRLTKLEELDLRCNRLVLEEGTFEDLTNLKSLNLGSNYLCQIKANVFSGLENLERLGLVRNGLENLNEGVFSGLRALKKLNLNRNELKFTSLRVLEELTNIESIDLRKNHINKCDIILTESENLKFCNIKF